MVDGNYENNNYKSKITIEVFLFLGMKEHNNIISFYYKKSCTHDVFFYPHINYQGYQQASSDKRRLPTQDRTWDFTVSSQPQNSQLESSGCLMQLLPRAHIKLAT